MAILGSMLVFGGVFLWLFDTKISGIFTRLRMALLRRGVEIRFPAQLLSSLVFLGLIFGFEAKHVFFSGRTGCFAIGIESNWASHSHL